MSQRALRRWRLLVAIFTPLLMIATALFAVAVLKPCTAVGAPLLSAGLPNHFMFGVANPAGQAGYLDTMRASNGTAWDIRDVYLSNGVNTSNNWTTWASPPGQYATNYMQESARHGYIPEFVYYNLLQSSGPSGANEKATDLAHLAAPSTMTAYYANWALLMHTIGAFNGVVVVIVEPDLWGYIEQAAVSNGTNSAASIPASVSSSGNADAQGLPDTAQGFAWALLHIRDLYAPGALLALHASPFGTWTDIASTTSTRADGTAIGTQEGQFLNTEGLVGNPSNVSTFDLLSNDLTNHDSGQSGIWWDKYNITVPNFARYLAYIAAMTSQTHRHLIMWQVPEGNQFFETMDNSPGHTQDNRPEYILNHVPDLVRAGVIGVLFGGLPGRTSIYDARGDGVTNPAPINTYECNLCNNHISSYADDDGGYLRIFVGQYYRTGGYSTDGTPPSYRPYPYPAIPPRGGAPTSTATSSRQELPPASSKPGSKHSVCGSQTGAGQIGPGTSDVAFVSTAPNTVVQSPKTTALAGSW